LAAPASRTFCFFLVFGLVQLSEPPLCPPSLWGFFFESRRRWIHQRFFRGISFLLFSIGGASCLFGSHGAFFGTEPLHPFLTFWPARGSLFFVPPVLHPVLFPKVEGCGQRRVLSCRGQASPVQCALLLPAPGNLLGGGPTTCCWLGARRPGVIPPPLTPPGRPPAFFFFFRAELMGASAFFFSLFHPLVC